MTLSADSVNLLSRLVSDREKLHRGVPLKIITDSALPMDTILILSPGASQLRAVVFDQLPCSKCKGTPITTERIDDTIVVRLCGCDDGHEAGLVAVINPARVIQIVVAGRKGDEEK